MLNFEKKNCITILIFEYTFHLCLNIYACFISFKNLLLYRLLSNLNDGQGGVKFLLDKCNTNQMTRAKLYT